MWIWRIAWHVFVLIGVSGLAVASVPCVVRSDAWLADLLDSFRLHVLVGVCIALPMAFTLPRRWRGPALAILAGCVIVNGATILRTARAATAPSEARGGIRLKLVTVNLLWSNREHRKLLDWLEIEAPDILVTQETTQRWAAQLDKLNSPLEYHRLPGTNDDIAILSRYPFEMAEISEIRSHGTLAVAMLEVGDRRIDVMTLHASVPLRPAWRIARDTMFDGIACYARRSRYPLIVAGDFNATPWNRSMRLMVRESPLRHAPGFWHPTWADHVPLWMGIPIDHVLAATGCRIVDRRVGPDIGSDHRPVVATIDCL